MNDSARLAWAAVPTRPVYHEELGRFLRKMREGKGFGLRQVVAMAEGRGLKALTKQALEGIEKGITRHFDPEVLRAMSTLYKEPYDDLVSRYVQSEYGLSNRDLLRHASTTDSGSRPLKGGANVPAEARMEQDRKIRHKKFGKEIRAASLRLFAIATALVEDREAVFTETRRSGSARKPRG